LLNKGSFLIYIFFVVEKNRHFSESEKWLAKNLARGQKNWISLKNINKENRREK